MSTAGKVIGGIAITALVGALGFTSYWTIKNWDKVKTGVSGADLYTREDIDNSYKDGYNTALKNKEEYLKQIETLKAKIEELNKTIVNNNDRINLLNITISNNEATITSLNSQITSLQAQVTSLSEDKTNNEATITSLNRQLVTLTTQKQELEATNTNLQSQVTSLITDKDTLTQQLADALFENERLQKLMEAYENQNKVSATFRVKNDVYKIILLTPGSKITETIADPTNGNKMFLGWTLDGVTVIDDISTIEITEDIVFIAKFEVYVVNFINMGKSFSTEQTIEYGNQHINTSLIETPTMYQPSSMFDMSWANNLYTFKGWSKNGKDIVYLENEIIENDTTYYAIYEFKHSGVYTGSITVNGTNYYLTFKMFKSGIIFASYNIDGSEDDNFTECTIYDGYGYNCDFRVFTRLFVFKIIVNENGTLSIVNNNATYDPKTPKILTKTNETLTENTFQTLQKQFMGIKNWGDIEVSVLNIQIYGNMFYIEGGINGLGFVDENNNFYVLSSNFGSLKTTKYENLQLTDTSLSYTDGDGTHTYTFI